MTPEERLTRIEALLEHHIDFVGGHFVALENQVQKTSAQVESLVGKIDALINQVNRTAAAQKFTTVMMAKSDSSR